MIRALGLGLASVLVMVFFRVTGYISDLSLGLGFLALVIGMILINRGLERWPGPAAFAATIYMIWAVVAVLLPLGFSYFQDSLPYNARAIRDSQVAGDIDASERHLPSGLRGRNAYKRLCDKVSEAQGALLEAESLDLEQKLLQEPRNKQLLAEKKVLEGNIRDNIAEREKCREFLLATQHRVQADLPWYGRVSMAWWIVAALAVALAIALFRPFAGRLREGDAAARASADRYEYLWIVWLTVGLLALGLWWAFSVGRIYFGPGEQLFILLLIATAWLFHRSKSIIFTAVAPLVLAALFFAALGINRDAHKHPAPSHRTATLDEVWRARGPSVR